MTIHVLPPDVAAKIAAGEVVERPANVAKELIENSLDAGAAQIQVEIRQGGQRLLRVTDDGHGIPADEVPLAFERHATSKLTTAEDLNHIVTLGFRGEALYSIAAVSQVTLSSRHRGADFGVQVRLEGGRPVSQGKIGLPAGTVVQVEHIFYNMPARREFLRKPATEAGHISAVVQRYALAYPDRRFSLVNEGRLVFQSTGSGDLFDVLAKVYSLEDTRQMVAIGKQGTRDAGQEAEIGDSITVFGYVSPPTLHRANRSHIDLFVNRRYIEDRSLTHAVVQAYHTLLPVGRYPIAAVLVEIDPGQVDVNIHPRKTEVRFRQANRVFSAVQKAVRQAVIENAAVPDVSLARPVPDEDRSPQTGWAARRESILGAGRQRALDIFMPAPPTAAEATSLSPRPDVPSAHMESSDRTTGDVLEGASPAATPPEPGRQAKLPPLRVVGQVGATYIIAEGPDGLFLIDQHAAHERIMYERFMAQRYGTVDGQVARQGLLDPLTMHVGDERAGLLVQHLDELAAVGFDVEPFGGDTFLVRSIPSVLAGQDPHRMLDEIVEGLANQRNIVGEQLEDRLVKMICKRASVKAGQVLSDIEMRELVRQLERCRSPHTCPHGRPTMIQLSAGDLEKAFGRV